MRSLVLGEVDETKARIDWFQEEVLSKSSEPVTVHKQDYEQCQKTCRKHLQSPVPELVSRQRARRQRGTRTR